MRMRRFLSHGGPLFVLGGLLAASGCGGGGRADEVLDDLPAAVIDPTEPPTSMSAPQMFFLGVAATGMGMVGTTSSCPARTESGGVVTLEGGCTDEEGEMWFGRATFPASSSMRVGDGTITYEGFGSDEASQCETMPGARHRSLLDGQVDVSVNGATTEFVIDLTVEGSGVEDDCSTVASRGAVAYTGRFTEEGERQTWSGSGRFGAQGAGVYDARTDDEVLDSSVCDSEALSGTTTVTGGSDVVVITYDGETDCSPDSTVTWTLNGEPQGTLSGVRCSTSGVGRGASSSVAAALAACGLLALSRRRRRR